MACGDYVGGYGNFVYQDTVYSGYQETGMLEYFAEAEENEAVYERLKCGYLPLHEYPQGWYICVNGFSPLPQALRD